jgi:hypothetical protein
MSQQDPTEAAMRIKTLSAAIGAGAVLAFAAVPAALGYEVDASHHSTSSMSAQRLSARDEARWNAEAKGDKLMRARAQAAQALKASGWYSEAKYYG